jgi:hypothetical protein
MVVQTEASVPSITEQAQVAQETDWVEMVVKP